MRNKSQCSRFLSKNMMKGTEDMKTENNQKEISKIREQLVKTPKQLRVHLYYMNNTKAFAMLFDGSLVPNKWEVVKGTDFGGKATEIRIRKVGGGDDIPKLEAIDRVVMDAIYTLIRNGYTCVSHQSIAKVVYGTLEKRMHDTQIKLIAESISRLQQIAVDIRCDNELEARGVKIECPEGVDMKFFSSLLNEFGGTYMAANGKEVTAIYLNKNFLYLYAEACGQIISVPWEIRDVSNANSVNEAKVVIKRVDTDMILIRDYLIRRIEIMKHPNTMTCGNVISYNWYDKNTGKDKGMFPELGYGSEAYTSWRNKKFKLDSIIEALMVYFATIQYIDTAYRKKDDKRLFRNSPITGWYIFLPKK